MDCTNFAAKTRLILLVFACFLYGSLRFHQIAPNSPQTINTSNFVHCFHCIFTAKWAHPPFSLQIIKRFAADQRHFKDKVALLLQTCDKSCSGNVGGEEKWRFRWGPVNICNLDGVLRFSASKAWQQLLSHVSSNNANLCARCRWSRVKRMISFQVPIWDGNFCYTSAEIMQIRSRNVVGLEWNAWSPFRS